MRAGHATCMGLDVHKEGIAVSVARAGREVAQSSGEIANRPKVIGKLVDRLNRKFGGEVQDCCQPMGVD